MPRPRRSILERRIRTYARRSPASQSGSLRCGLCVWENTRHSGGLGAPGCSIRARTSVLEIIEAEPGCGRSAAALCNPRGQNKTFECERSHTPSPKKSSSVQSAKIAAMHDKHQQQTGQDPQSRRPVNWVRAGARSQIGERVAHAVLAARSPDEFDGQDSQDQPTCPWSRHHNCRHPYPAGLTP
jgi:hypothetical protein